MSVSGDVAKEVGARRRPRTVLARQAGPRGLFYTDENGGRRRVEYGRWLLQYTAADGTPRFVEMDDVPFNREYETISNPYAKGGAE